MVGHAAAAEWLRTLPWRDWRGWSDWFYGGQAIGVNYPPLGHAWMRFTDPVHGQMAAVAVGLLVVLPWGALRLARAVGYSPRAQRASVAAVLVLAALSAYMHLALSGFHQVATFYGSWPAMVAVVAGLHAAAEAARCRRPVAAGVITGVAGLFNATVVPGGVRHVGRRGAAVQRHRRARRGCGVHRPAGHQRRIVSTGSPLGSHCRSRGSGGERRWLVPFLDGRERLVRWEVPRRSWLISGANDGSL